VSEWRVGHQGRDGMYYEERVNGSWQRIEVQGEMLMGPAHHVIYFASAAAWERYPDWARGRRDEIIGRIKSEFRPPDYEYQGEGVEAAPSGPDPAPRQQPRAKQPIQGMRALLIAITLMLAISGGMAWLVVNGITKGQTTLPLKRATLQRQVLRADEPATYWLSIVIYSGIGLGTLGLAVWGLRERRRLLTSSGVRAS
jgi:hypothetical protein